jgi:hypothetical protein
MTPIDKDALERAMAIAQREPGRRGQLESMLEDQPWHEVAEFAAHCVQGDALDLYPWETPPCDVSDEPSPDEGQTGRVADETLPAARKLLHRLLAAGLSRYEPNPLAALARVEKAR